VSQLPIADQEVLLDWLTDVLEILHVTTKRFVAEGQHAGTITLLARDGKIVDFQPNSR
jgi:hypothetical protein